MVQNDEDIQKMTQKAYQRMHVYVLHFHVGHVIHAHCFDCTISTCILAPIRYY